MSFPKKLLLAALYLSIFVSGLEAQTIFAVPSQAGQATAIFSGDPFALRNSLTASNVAFMAVANPAGSKIYIVQRSGSDTVLVIDGANFSNVLKRFSFGSNGEGAAMTPNGQRLLVASGTLHVIDTTTDAEIASVAAGASPTDVAVSRDSAFAYVLSPSSGTLTAVNLTTNQVTGTALSVPGGATSVEVGPNGLIYVTAINRLFEIDPNTFTVRAEIPLNARPGEPVFTPDGRYALALNQTPVTGSSVLVFDLASRTLAGVIPNLGGALGNVILNRLVVAGNNRIYATREGGGVLYEITLSPLTINEASYSGIDPLSNAQAIVASGEFPTPKYLFAATAGSLYRFDSTTNILAPIGQLGLPALPIALLAATVPSTGNPTSILAYNTNQILPNTGGTGLPMIIRALDASGRPVVGAAVSFQTSSTGLTFSRVSTVTDAQGYAQAVATLPATAGAYTVTASAGGSGGPSTTFNLTVSGTGGGTGGIGGVSIVSGNGQIVVEQFQIQDPMVVVVRDPNGTPVSGATVSFQIATGSGTLTSSTFSGTPTSVLSCDGITCTTTTDAQGRASTGFLGTAVPGGLSFTPTTVLATSGSSSVTFTLNTVIRMTFGGQFAPPPSTELIKPIDSRVITAQAGQTIPGAIQVRVVSGLGQAMPGVGLTVSTGLDSALFPSASCAGGTVLTDATGVATCDLVIGNRIGVDVPVRVNVGSFRDLGNLLLSVTPGPPAIARLAGGNLQTGNPGERLPRALLAVITDLGGNPLPGVQATFEVISGAATLSNVFNISDANGQVSALVTLGSSPGPTQIRVRAGAASAVFTVTTNVTISGIARVSGDAQVAQIGTPFAQPLVVAVTDDQGRPVAGARVSFTVSGGGTLGAASATTNASGRAEVTVTAGPTAGAITVTAAVQGGPSTTFNLTARLPGPVFSDQSFFNAASNSRGISPGSLAIITVSGVAPDLRGCNVATNFGLGVLPTTLATVQVQFGSTLAPIAYICNIGGRETVAVQVPFEMAAGLVPVVIRVGQANTTVNNVPILALSPGIFEHMIDGRRYAVLQRSDGSFVSNTNRAQRGELIRAYVTGLGQTTPATGTNRPGTVGQAVAAPVIVGVNNAGVRVVSVETLPGVVGVYVVTFEVPQDAPSGDSVFNLAAGEQAALSFSQSSIISVQ